MPKLRAANILCKVTEFVTECGQDLVLVFHGVWRVPVRSLYAIDGVLLRSLTIKEWNEFVASSLGSESQRDSREAVNSIKAEENVVVLRSQIIRRVFKLVACYGWSPRYL